MASPSPPPWSRPRATAPAASCAWNDPEAALASPVALPEHRVPDIDQRMLLEMFDR